MRVLVTGASGFLGGHVLDSLRRHGIETMSLGRRRPVGVAPEAFIEADLLDTPDYSTLVRAAGASHLLHLAWYAEHGQYWTSSLNLRWVEASTRLVETFCAAGGRHVVVAGSCAEYDWSHGYCREDGTPTHPSTLYGTAKDAARRLAMAVCVQHGVSCAWGRVFLLHGKSETSQRLIPSLVDVFQGRRAPFSVNAELYRDFLHAADVAEGFVSLLRNGADGVFNISSGEPVRLAEVVRELARLLDADPQCVLNLASARPGESPLLVGENLKLKALGWRPELSLAQGLARSVREVPA
jgi:nucleoside-diphosphate-sugar epimerase